MKIKSNMDKLKQKGQKDRITGKHLFTGDLFPSNTLFGAFLRLRPARVKLLTIDISKIKEFPGVTHVFTYKDFGNNMPRFGPDVQDQPLFADGVTRFSGEPIGLVLADNEESARRAAELATIEYEELIPALSAEDSLSPSSHIVQAPQFRKESPYKNTNIMDQWQFEWGDIKKGKESSDLIIENTYRAPFIHHYAIETPSVVSIPDDEGVSIYTPTQSPFVLRRTLSGMLDIPANRIRIVSMDMGGSFGSKGYAKIEPAAAYYSLLLQQPIKITLSSEEAFFTAQREASVVTIKTGFKKNGKIAFQDIDAHYPVGAYMDISSRVISKCTFHSVGPYHVEHALVKGAGVYTNTPPTTAFRGFGNTHTGMAVENQLNAAANQLEIDPIEIRLMNLAKKGEVFIPGESPADGEWPALLRKAEKAVGWSEPKGKTIGRGVAFGMKASKPATLSQARVVLHHDASASVYIGTTEMGQGTRTVMSNIVSRCLDIPHDKISILLGDTGIVPFDTLTAASRSVVNMGNALEKACSHIKQQLLSAAELYYNDKEPEINLKNATISISGEHLPLTALMAKLLGNPMGEIIGEGSYKGEKIETHPLGGKAPFFEAVVTAVELEVDKETGSIRLRKIVHASDVGKLLNPERAVGVDEGGNVMGIGIALSENIQFGAEGELLNGSSLDYRIPTICDIPVEHISIFQENQDGPGYDGAKGIGEGGMLAIVPAIMGAIYDATGIFFTEIPITPEKLWEKLQHLSNKP